MKKLLFIVICLISSLSFSQGLEEQRKYVFAKSNEAFKELIKNGETAGLTLYGHSVYTYYDIYLDTENFDLLKNNLSLRIRKRNFDANTVEFGMQLKNEMLKNGDIRMEIEEDELKFYKIYHQGETYMLKDVISEMVSAFEARIDSEDTNFHNDIYIQKRVELIGIWANFKMNSNVGPFQKLRRLGLNLAELKTLKPVLIGQSQRQRSHIFVDRNNTTDDLIDLPASTRSVLETPEMLRGKDTVWVMESSLDYARFFSLFSKHNMVEINEYEVENKYINTHENTALNLFESSLLQNYGAEVNLESKYRQSMLKILDK